MEFAEQENFVKRCARGFPKNRFANVEDIEQELWVKLLSVQDKLDKLPESEQRAFLYTTLRNYSVDHFRKMKRRQDDYAQAEDLVDLPDQSVVDLYCETKDIANVTIQRLLRYVGMDLLPDGTFINYSNRVKKSLKNLVKVIIDPNKEYEKRWHNDPRSKNSSSQIIPLHVMAEYAYQSKMLAYKNLRQIRDHLSSDWSQIMVKPVAKPVLKDGETEVVLPTHVAALSEELHVLGVGIAVKNKGKQINFTIGKSTIAAYWPGTTLIVLNQDYDNKAKITEDQLMPSIKKAREVFANKK